MYFCQKIHLNKTNINCAFKNKIQMLRRFQCLASDFLAFSGAVDNGLDDGKDNEADYDNVYPEFDFGSDDNKGNEDTVGVILIMAKLMVLFLMMTMFLFWLLMIVILLTLMMLMMVRIMVKLALYMLMIVLLIMIVIMIMMLLMKMLVIKIVNKLTIMLG